MVTKNTGDVPFACFSGFHHMVAALCLLPVRDSRAHPDSCWEIDGDHPWAVPMDCFACDVASLQTVFEQCHWDVQLLRGLPAKARQRSVTDLVDGSWYRRLDMGTGQDGPFRHTSQASLDPDVPNFRYIVAVKDRQQASQVLDILTGCLALGLEARPMVPKPIDEKGPYAFFWSIRRNTHPVSGVVWENAENSPPLSVIDAAERVWWGPVCGAEGIYLQWPYDIRIPAEVWARHGRAAGLDIVLLSAHPPHQVRLKIPKGPDHFESLIDVADLRANREPSILIPYDERSTGPTGFRFDVELKLVEPDERRSPANQIAQLELDIAAQCAILDDIKERTGHEDEDADIFFEPLYLYTAAKGEIPYQLRRILLEWCGQREDLGSLRYMKLDPASLPEGFLWSGPPPACEVHVLTTAAVKGESQRADTGLRLSRYRPGEGLRNDFEWMQAWSAWLNLFVPCGRTLELYPDLRPGELAARKLAEALLPPPDQHDPKAWCIILFPGHNGQVRAMRLPRDGFRPLVDSFDWRCNLDLGQLDVRLSDSTLDRVREQFAESVQRAFGDPAEKQALGKLEKEKKNLIQQYQTHTATLQEYAKELATIHTHTTQVAKTLVDARSGLGEVDSLRKDLRHELTRIRAGASQLNGLFQQCRTLETRIKELRTHCDILEKRWNDLSQREDTRRKPSPPSDKG